jgi:L-cysteine desulfidase
MDFQDKILTLIKSGVMPALGCTEPGAVALASAYAGQALGESPVRVEISVDSNVYKNGMAVGVPGTGKVGLAIAAALGALIRDPSLELSVLCNITPEYLKQADSLISENKVDITLNDHQGLYISAVVFGGKGNARAVIEGRHTNLVLLERDGKVISHKINHSNKKSVAPFNYADVTLSKLISAVEAMPDDSFDFFDETIQMNMAAARIGLSSRLGMAVGANYQDLIEKKVLADDSALYAKVLTAAAADARMSGENIPVMSVAGSGNHGLTAILPVLAVAERMNMARARLLRALAISTLTTIYIKSYTGSLSALCGCAVAAATGASAAIVWMLGGTRDQIDATIKNMIANLTGMICDGGKVGCALKLATAASVAVETALLSINNVLVPTSNGIIFPTADDTIRNLGMVSNPGMLETDKVILDIMLEKDKLPSGQM